MRRGMREACFSHSLTHTSFFFPTTYRLFYLCLSCVLGYGWKRLDFDSFTTATKVVPLMRQRAWDCPLFGFFGYRLFYSVFYQVFAVFYMFFCHYPVML